MQIQKRRTVHVFNLIATLILVVSLVSAAGTFVYTEYYLKQQLDDAKTTLSEMSESENTQKMEEIRRYDEQLKMAEMLVNNHLAVSTVFSVLESTTKSAVQFDSFALTYDPGAEVTLSLAGNADTLSSVARQKMQYLGETLFSEFVIQDIALQPVTVEADASKSSKTAPKATQEDRVGFSVTGLLRPSLLEYDVPSAQVEQSSGVPAQNMDDASQPEVVSDVITPEI